MLWVYFRPRWDCTLEGERGIVGEKLVLNLPFLIRLHYAIDESWVCFNSVQGNCATDLPTFVFFDASIIYIQKMDRL